MLVALAVVIALFGSLAAPSPATAGLFDRVRTLVLPGSSATSTGLLDQILQMFGGGSSTARLTTVSALSQHRLLATFNKTPSGDAVDPAKYTITGPAGPLPVVSVTPTSGNQATIATGTQQAVAYQITGPAANATPISFTGSADAEPALLSAISTGNTTVVLGFNEPMGAGADQPGSYKITVTGQSTSLAVSGVEVGADPSQVTLTTAAQADTSYTVRVGDVRGQGGELVDPTANASVFAGTRS